MACCWFTVAPYSISQEKILYLILASHSFRNKRIRNIGCERLKGLWNCTFCIIGVLAHCHSNQFACLYFVCLTVTFNLKNGLDNSTSEQYISKMLQNRNCFYRNVKYSQTFFVECLVREFSTFSWTFGKKRLKCGMRKFSPRLNLKETELWVHCWVFCYFAHLLCNQWLFSPVYFYWQYQRMRSTEWEGDVEKQWWEGWVTLSNIVSRLTSLVWGAAVCYCATTTEYMSGTQLTYSTKICVFPAAI